MYFKLVNPANSHARWLLVFFLEIGIASGLYAYSQVVTSFYLIYKLNKKEEKTYTLDSGGHQH